VDIEKKRIRTAVESRRFAIAVGAENVEDSGSGALEEGKGQCS